MCYREARVFQFEINENQAKTAVDGTSIKLVNKECKDLNPKMAVTILEAKENVNAVGATETISQTKETDTFHASHSLDNAEQPTTEGQNQLVKPDEHIDNSGCTTATYESNEGTKINGIYVSHFLN